MAIVYLGGGDFWNVFPVYGLASAGTSTWAMVAADRRSSVHLVLPIACMTVLHVGSAIAVHAMWGCWRSFARISYALLAPRAFRKGWLCIATLCGTRLLPIITLMADLLPRVDRRQHRRRDAVSIPGMGALSYEAVFSRDYPLIMAIFTLSAC